MRSDMKRINNRILRIFMGLGVLSFLVFLIGLTTVATAFSASFSNRIVSLTPFQDDKGSGIKVVAEKEIGSRYTSYLLSKPPRVVFDFQGADISTLPAVTKFSENPIKEIRVSLYETAAVKSGRVELILIDRVPYKVEIDGNVLRVNFATGTNLSSPLAVVSETQPLVVLPPSVVAESVVIEPLVVTEQIEPSVKEIVQPEVQLESAVIPEPSSVNNLSATNVSSISAHKGEILLHADGALDRCKSFALKSPARFVVDCFGVKENISEKSVRLTGPINLVRVGNYSDKVRFVLEGEGKVVAKLVTFPIEKGMSLHFDGKTPVNIVPTKNVIIPVAPPENLIVTSPTLAPLPFANNNSSEKVEDNLNPNEIIATKPPVVEEQSASEPVKAKVKEAPIIKVQSVATNEFMNSITVEKVDFKVEDGKSYVIVALSAPGEVMQPLKDKSLLRFGVKRATITPSLRRTIDASAFPSVIRQITPYTVNNRGQNDVRFAIELKGDTSYELKNTGKMITLIVDNGKFNKINTARNETIEVPITPTNLLNKKTVEVLPLIAETPSFKVSNDIITDETVKITKDKKYSGMLVSLNFDNIEIRNVLLLIAEVSNTNIIANDDVKGIITLRLNNVPWDQALDVIMESKGLAMEREGNILRIAPKELILKRKLDKASMETELSEKSPNVTKAFSVSYGPVEDIAKKITDQIKGKGTVSADARTRQIIVTTTPDRLKEIEEQIINRLDVPDKQVTIEARIVEANSNFTRDLGVSWGISQQGTAQGPWDLSGAMITGGGSFTINPGTQATSTTAPVFNSSAGIGSQFSFGRIGIDSTILDLRLSALEASGYGKIVSTPRITTSNGEAAEISQGTQIPYQSTSDKGTETKFIAATLALKVKPVINPDQSMVLEIEVSNDSVGSTVATGIGSAPSINTKKAKTKVLVKNGETTVIGGIFIESETESEAGIPFLRSIPIIGYLFKSTKKSKDKTELMIFITPRIVE